MPIASKIVPTRSLVNAKNIVYDALVIESGLSRMAAKRPDWKAKAKGVLRAELARQDLSYADLAKKLAEIGIKDNELNIKNKIGRGSFTAVFLLQCLAAIGVHTIHLNGD